ncbi:MAG TPA: ATP-binding protein [Solirubrobacteraceae bacterium]|nr:ATP-binding protein [Solirubrobacteraceae bacterium]
MAERAAVSFAELDERIRRGVEQIAAAEAEAPDPFRGLYITDEHARTLASGGPPPEIEERLDELAGLLGLDPLERSVLAVCAAPEVSSRYARLYGYLHDDLTRQLASPRLAAALLAGGQVAGEDVLARLDAGATLRRRGAVELLDEPRLPLAERPLKCAEAVAARLLAGAVPADDRALAELVSVPAVAPAGETTLRELRQLLGSETMTALVVVGADAPAALAAALGQPVMLARARGMQDANSLPSVRLRAALAGAVLALTGLHELAPEDRDAAWRALTQDVERALVCVDPVHESAVLGRGPMLVARVTALSSSERRAAWVAQLPGADVGEVAVKFRLSVAQIEQAAEIARARARVRGAVEATGADLDHAARTASRHGLEGLAGRVEVGDSTWEDLIVPDRAARALRMIPSFLRYRDRVLDWGYGAEAGMTPGMTVLFAGESGTGKTMASRVVARDLGLDLFRIDLATVVSKFIGETEKQLDRVFAGAEGSNAILLFDEADALFGKRSEVHDAHDRYANVEVAYLLQRIERYEGAVILTSNLRHNIDAAFLRRLDLVVEFPFPEEEERRRLWRRLLPARAPLADIDVDFLATRFKLSGGSIRNVSFAAALLAAGDGGRVTMEHLARGIALEYEKLGRLTLEADFDRLYPSVRPPAARTSGQ